MRFIKFSRDERSKPMHEQENVVAAAAHEGIKIVEIEDNVAGESSGGNSDVGICVITWNMNGKVSYEDLEELIGNNREFDLLVIGFQEAPRANIRRLLQSALVDSHILLAKATMQSLQLYVFGNLKNSDMLLKEVKVDKHSIGGYGGLIRRKKGAVGIFLNYKGIRMLFVSCHLSAHPHKVAERNMEFRDISQSLFSKNCNPFSKSAQITIWLGDLNYRIQGISTHPVRNLIQKDLHRMLTSKDQLLQEAERGRIFNGYCEGTLNFKPTYKYNVGSSDYDTSYKVRVPSWTDRILFKTDDEEKINASLRCYESIDEILSSDHKPVKAQLYLNVM